MMTISQGDLEILRPRFATKYSVESDGCWRWIVAIGSHGYGVIGLPGRRGRGVITAHRLSWLLHRGELPPGASVCHTCDRRWCVNPDHLFVGSQADNMRDASQKGRTASGARNHLSKLTNKLAVEIRSLSPSLTQAQLAAKFGVHQGTIQAVLDGKTWRGVLPKHVELKPVKDAS